MIVAAYTMIVIPSAMLALIFLCTSIHGVCKNETTFDSFHDKGAVKRNSRGCWGNVKEVFGESPWLWLVPTVVNRSTIKDPVEVV
jgi:hypothetical protein